MRYVGFVRNVMIGREGLHRVVLLERVAAAGGTHGVSFITTGNVAFDLDPGRLEGFVEALETGIAEVIGRREPVFVRTVAALQQVVAAQPFSHLPDDAIEHTICFARARLALSCDVPWTSKRGDAVIFAVEGTEAYCHSRMIGGRTTGAGGYVEGFAGQGVTSRGWRTVARIVDKETQR